MKKSNFYIISLKQNILPFLFLLFIFFLVVFSKTNLIAAREGLTLWATAVVPSLFPFFIATELLSYTNIVNILGKFLEKIMRPLFNVPGNGAFAFILGMISGYPVGAKIVTKLRNDSLCSKREGERLLAFTNNSGPLFIIGTVGCSMFGNSEIGFLLLITHILSCITVGIFLGIKDRFFLKCEEQHTSFTKKNVHNKEISRSCNFSDLGEILGKSISSAISSIVMIGGFVVLFSVILSMLENSNILYIICNSLSSLLNSLNLNDSIFTGFITRINRIDKWIKKLCKFK